MNILNYKLFGQEWSDYANNWQVLLDHLNNDNTIKIALNIGVGEPRPNGELACKLWNYLLKNEIHSLETITNLEININLYNKAKKSNDFLLNDTILGDVRDFNPDIKFDLVFWSHGPEHIYREEWLDTFAGLESMAKKWVILQMPGGTGYDFSPSHLAKDIQKGEMEQFGYTVMYDGVWDTTACGILAYKKII